MQDVTAMLGVMDADARVASVCASCVHPETGFEETKGIERFASGGNAESGYDVVNIAGGGSLLQPRTEQPARPTRRRGISRAGGVP